MPLNVYPSHHWALFVDPSKMCPNVFVVSSRNVPVESLGSLCRTLSAGPIIEAPTTYPDRGECLQLTSQARVWFGMHMIRKRQDQPTTTVIGRLSARIGLTAALALGAMTLGLGGTANAASHSTWDRIARCESGSNWSANTGNGYYGGLQFSAATWRAHGGGAHASLPHRASKRQQIAVAERVLRSQGWRAWPTCSRV